jgi:hypothetical protein
VHATTVDALDLAQDSVARWRAFFAKFGIAEPGATVAVSWLSCAGTSSCDTACAKSAISDWPSVALCQPKRYESAMRREP